VEELVNTLGDRRVTLLRELTKKYETALLTTLSGILKEYEAKEPRGECVLVVEGLSYEEILEEEKKKWDEVSLSEHMEYYTVKGMDKKEAMKAVAKDLGVSKREVYRKLLEE
jgi:16S rRNA (cytidine1402-2'-O)-methyltransferase